MDIIAGGEDGSNGAELVLSENKARMGVDADLGQWC